MKNKFTNITYSQSIYNKFPNDADKIINQIYNYENCIKQMSFLMMAI